MNRYEKHSLAGRRKIKPFLSLKNGSEKFFSSSRHSRETEPNAKLVFAKPNTQNVSEINSFNKFNFSQSQNKC